MVQKMLGLCETENGTQTVELLQAEQVGTKEHGKMLDRIQVLEDGRIPAKEARHWNTSGQKKGLWNVARKKMLQDRALSWEEGYIAMHEDNFFSSWLREDVESTEERRKKMDKKTREVEK